MRETKVTFCRICEAACGLEAIVEDGEVVELRPDAGHVVSRGYACVKGVRFLDVHDSPDRLKSPLARRGDSRVPVSWQTALGELGPKLRAILDAHGPDAIGCYIGNPPAFNTTHPVYLHGLLSGIGTRNVFGAGSQDCNNKFVVATEMYGAPAIQPMPDIDRTGCVVMVGTNPAVSHASHMSLPRPMERLRAIEERGGRVFWVNPRRTESAQMTGTQVFLRPDTDVFFLAAFLNEVFARDGVDRPRAQRHMRGLAQLRQAVAAWTPERTAEVTGVDAETLRAVVEAYLDATRRGAGASLYASTGVNQGRQGTLAFWFLQAINAVTGNLDRVGGAIVAKGLVDVPKLMKRTGLGMRDRQSRIGGYDAVLDTFPASVLPDEILTEGPGRIRALIVSAGNPLLSCADEHRMREAFSALDLLVVVDMFQNETADLAHYCLPATSFLERADLPLAVTGFALDNYAQYTDAVVAPDGEQKPEHWIFRELARAMGVPMFGSRVAGGLLRLGRRLETLPLLGSHIPDGDSLLSAMVASSGQTTMRELRDHPHGVRLPAHPGDVFLSKRVLTDDGLVDLAPKAFVETASRELEAQFDEELAVRGSLKLISKREKRSHNSWMHNSATLMRGKHRQNLVYMHPDDAAARGLEAGARVQVATSHDAIELPLATSVDLMAGTIAVPHGWGHGAAEGLGVARGAAGVNVNRLSASGPGTIERLSGMTFMTGFVVEVMAAEAPVADNAE